MAKTSTLIIDTDTGPKLVLRPCTNSKGKEIFSIPERNAQGELVHDPKTGLPKQPWSTKVDADTFSALPNSITVDGQAIPTVPGKRKADGAPLAAAKGTVTIDGQVHNLNVCVTRSPNGTFNVRATAQLPGASASDKVRPVTNGQLA